MAVWLSSIDPPVTPGNVVVTDVPFEPVAVMFWGTRNSGTIVNQMFGVTSGPGEDWAMWMSIAQETSGYANRFRELRNDACIFVRSQDTLSVQSKATCVSFNSDGFTLAFTGSNIGRPVFYMAIGGQNIQAAKAGTFSTPASTGTVAVTGTGFLPKALVVGHVFAIGASDPVNTKVSQGGWGLGFTDGTNQHSSFGFAQAFVATGGFHMQRTDAVACGTDAVGDYRAALQSFDADGFTVNVVDAHSLTTQHGYLAIDCAAAAVGTSEIPDSTGVVSYATSGFEPGGVLFSWNGADAPSTVGVGTTTPVRIGVGGMDGVLNMPTKPEAGSVVSLHRDTAPFGSYQPRQTWAENSAVHLLGVGSQVDAGAVDPLSIAEFESFAMDEFVLDWTTASTNSRTFGWLALPGHLVIPWIPQIYRRIFGQGSPGPPPPASFLLLGGGTDRLLLETGDGYLIL